MFVPEVKFPLANLTAVRQEMRAIQLRLLAVRCSGAVTIFRRSFFFM
jgi:hypothetical protein